MIKILCKAVNPCRIIPASLSQGFAALPFLGQNKRDMFRMKIVARQQFIKEEQKKLMAKEHWNENDVRKYKRLLRRDKRLFYIFIQTTLEY